MATLSRSRVTSTPANIISTLSLTAGSQYEFQNRGPSVIRVFDGGASAPDTNEGTEVHPSGNREGHPATFRFEAGSDPLWVWSVDQFSYIVGNDDA